MEITAYTQARLNALKAAERKTRIKSSFSLSAGHHESPSSLSSLSSAPSVLRVPRRGPRHLDTSGLGPLPWPGSKPKIKLTSCSVD
ncbi:hypothetical protein EYF80_050188 [Liparis tanakae]|uniref:Uncharacterized protein n=1 Tax=Liparis tanakae TaxID=230148 RepID=A0A4Z2FEL6_9TELE|nr:hypothetical protein EYF80_050188 [Liparis tanakae]